MIGIPESVTEEHEEIFSGLRSLAKTKGDTGKSVRDLLVVLEPHFEKEDEVAMPLLGAVATLSNGQAGGDLDEVIAMQERLSKELPSMLAEHKEISGRIETAYRAAEVEGNKDALRLLTALGHHARIEEEVLYPAAILSGVAAKSLKEVGRVRAA